MHIIAITTNADFKKGTLRIMPIAENANIAHVLINNATSVVAIGASKVCCFDDAIINSGARANIYQLGPPTIHSKCQAAAAKAIMPALNSDFELTGACIIC